ncbi:MAG TPA: protease modulator HflC [Reyranella sp.]|nr:protease modulator HflC [Reyranella sp.]
MSNRAIALLIGLAVAILLLTQTFYTVDPTKQVLVRQFGALVGQPKTEPGLYAKWPFVQDVVRIDRRLLDYEAAEFEIIAGDQKRLVVDAYARYRIVDPRLFVERVPSGEQAGLRGLLDSLINSEIRGVLSAVPLHAVLTEQRASLMDDITKRVNAKTKDLGVQVVDVRIKRADLPQANSDSVYNRMKTDRQREAAQLRAQGDEEKQRITATADREVAVIKAEAGYKAQVTMAEADGEAAKIYADAFSKDKDFYGFWRRMEAYRQAFSSGGTMVLSPDSDFFRYFEQSPAAAKK